MTKTFIEHERVILSGTTVVILEGDDRRAVTLNGNRRKLIERVEARWSRTLDQIQERPTGYASQVSWSGRNVLKDGSLGAEWTERCPRLQRPTRHASDEERDRFRRDEDALRHIEDLAFLQVQHDQEAAVRRLKKRMEAM